MSEFYMKVAGVTHEGRQRIVARLQQGEPLQFVPEPDNPYDDHAVGIRKMDGQQIGYIPKEQNRQIFENLVNGRGEYKVSVTAVTGGGFGAVYGCNIRVEYCPIQKQVLENSPKQLSEANEYLRSKISLLLHLFNEPQIAWGENENRMTHELNIIRSITGDDEEQYKSALIDGTAVSKVKEKAVFSYFKKLLQLSNDDFSITDLEDYVNHSEAFGYVQQVRMENNNAKLCELAGLQITSQVCICENEYIKSIVTVELIYLLVGILKNEETKRSIYGIDVEQAMKDVKNAVIIRDGNIFEEQPYKT